MGNFLLAGTSMLCIVALAASGCGGDDIDCTPDPSYHPAVEPSQFTTTIDNPLMPLVPGTRWVYEGGGETIEVEVTTRTKVVAGVTCVVVRDIAKVDGEIVEDTDDWFAQDATGNVWYFGEDTKELENGQVVSTAGSWEAGVDGAQPGIAMRAQPAPGDAYRQEYDVCEAEDEAEVVATDVAITVPFGSYTGCLKTREFTRLEPGAEEYKYHCPGVGLVAEEPVGGGTRIELVSMTTTP
jgi:hypothetical protein